MSNGSGTYASYFSGTNVSIVKNEFSYCGSSCIILTNLGYKINKDIFIKENSFTIMLVAGLDSELKTQHMKKYLFLTTHFLMVVAVLLLTPLAHMLSYPTM